MKTSYFILLIFLLSSCFSTKLATSSKVEETIAVQGSKDELYNNANQWIVSAFKDPKSVIQLQDKAGGKITGKYFMKSLPATGLNGSTMPLDVYSTITITVMVNATKIGIAPFGDLKNFGSFMTVFTYSPEKVQTDAQALIKDYKNFMVSKEVVGQKPQLKVQDKAVSSSNVDVGKNSNVDIGKMNAGAKSIETAFINGDINGIKSILTDDAKALYGTDLSRINKNNLKTLGEALKTRELKIYTGLYAEYNYTKNGAKFSISMARQIDGSWKLMRF